MQRSPSRLVIAFAALGTSVAHGQVENFRLTEVDPDADQIEVTNTGGDHTTTVNRPFCHRITYFSNIPSGTFFAAGDQLVFTTVRDLADADSDLWLYFESPFDEADNIIHGVKYGPEPNVGRAGLAATVGLWPSASAFAPAPQTGATLAYDMFGFDPRDWYVDETPTMGAADSTTAGVVPSSLAWPSGTQDFEGMSLGDEVTAITDWVIVNTSATPGIFTVRSVADVNGVFAPPPGTTSTRWIRVRDQDDTDVQNRFYSPAIAAPKDAGYTWSFLVNLEDTPPGGADGKPRLTIQHDDGGFANAWGVEFADTGASLVVTGIGGTATSTPLYQLTSPTGVGDWVRIDLTVSFAADTVSASFNGGGLVSLPISLSATADRKSFRICYRGEGVGNVGTMLLDDVSVDVSNPAADCGDPMDATVSVVDLLALLAQWGNSGSCDIAPKGKPDGTVSVQDLLLLLAQWGSCPE